MAQRLDRNIVVVVTVFGVAVGVVLSVLREQVASTPLVLVNAVDLWVLGVSQNAFWASVVSASYMGMVFCLLTLCVRRRKALLIWGLVSFLLIMHVTLVWRSNIQAAPSIGEGFRLLFQNKNR